MAKIAGAIDATVNFLETISTTLPGYKFQNAAGKEMPVRDLTGLARSVQAATSVKQGAGLDETDIRSLESRFASIQAETRAMLAQLAKAQTP